MKTKIFTLVIALILMVSLFGAFPTLTAAASGHQVSHDLILGPKAEPVSNPVPNQYAFTCQRANRPAGMSVCYDPFQMRKAYGIDTLISQGYDGTGHTIVIIDAFSPATLEYDVDTFNTLWGLPARSTYFSIVQPDGVPPVDLGWSQEETLDVDWSHAMAPGAKVVLVEAKSNYDTDLVHALNYALDHNLGDIVSMSFGENDTCNLLYDPATALAWHRAFIKGTNKHVTFFASSGDQGAAQQTCDGSSWTQVVSSPASDPLVTGVGGTELHAAGYCNPNPAYPCDPTVAAGTYQGEIAWNEFTTNNAATGGGYSTVWSAPSYQTLLNPSQISRGVPDVAMNGAIYHGVLVHWGGAAGGWYLFGGTSCGTPEWAGLMAIANQMANKKLGFINKALYYYSANPARYATMFHDVTIGNNSVIEGGVPVAGYPATPGWDATTGLGSPMAAKLSFITKFVTDADAQQAIASSTMLTIKSNPLTGFFGPNKVSPH